MGECACIHALDVPGVGDQSGNIFASAFPYLLDIRKFSEVQYPVKQIVHCACLTWGVQGRGSA